MAKKASPKKQAAAKKKKPRKTGATNVDRMVAAGALDPDAANALGSTAVANIESMTTAEIEALIKAHLKVSPRKRWQPDPDGSIF